jgi:hypothetical protein
MAEDFTSKIRNPELENVINQARTVGELREMMLQELERQGQVVRTRESEFDLRRGPRAGAPKAQPALSLPAARPAAQPTCYRVLYLHGNDRLEIYGLSESELDQKEAALRAMYGGQR